GDWLVFRQCGAYGFTESKPYFLCHDIPAEIIIENNQYAVVRESVPAENWLK
ncbi:MAG TPA: PLP-dependent decarboxylase, partial [bacterium]|nr:PLP-dependent decarboxylase [bacterium]